MREQHNTTMDLPITARIDSPTHELSHAKPERSHRMKRPSIYVKMKVLGAIDVVQGKSRHERIHNVAQMTFLDEQGDPHRFTWRTIPT